MGYSVDAYGVFTLAPAREAEAIEAVRAAWQASEEANRPWGWVSPVQITEGTTLDEVLVGTGWDEADRWVTEEGVLTVSLSHGQSMDVDALHQSLEALAPIGVLGEVECRGEDDSLWHWRFDEKDGEPTGVLIEEFGTIEYSAVEPELTAAAISDFLAARLCYEETQDPFAPAADERLIDGSGADHASVLYELITLLIEHGFKPVSEPS